MRASRRLYLGVPALVAAGTLAFGFSASGGTSRKARAPVDPTVEAAHYAAVRDYTNAVVLNETVAWDGAAYWHGVELLAANYVPPAPPVIAAPAPRRTQARQLPAPSGGGTGQCGGATNGADHVIPKESGGNANAPGPMTSSGQAWGCYQITSGTWAGAGCSGSWGSASASEQAACASKLSPSAWPTW